MIRLYTWGTRNGRKVSIMLEETGLPYSHSSYRISRSEPLAANFLSLDPNSEVPATIADKGPNGAWFAVQHRRWVLA